MIQPLISFILAIFSSLDYGSIAILMAIESSFIPLPSEIIMPPAGYLASLGQLNFWGIIVAGTLGSVSGALICYFLAQTLGRRLLYKLIRSRPAKFFFLTEEKLKASEEFFKDHGKTSIFIARLVPGVRHLISLPAGLAEMNLIDFVISTAGGALVWNSILAGLGYWLGANQNLIKTYYHWIGLTGGVFFLIFIGYLIFKKFNRIKF